MRAAAFTGLGSPENVEVITVDEPSIGDEQVLLDVRGASLNRHDLIYLEGTPERVRMNSPSSRVSTSLA